MKPTELAPPERPPRRPGLDREELAKLLAEADAARAALRRTTREWRALGDRILAARQRGPDGPDDRGPARP